MYGMLVAGGQSRDRHAREGRDEAAACRRRGRSSAILANGSFTGSPALHVADPMSGFFMIRRDIVSHLAPRLSPDGFKILVDVILSARGALKIVEIPTRFASESRANRS